MNIYIHVPFCHGKCDYCAFYSEGYHTPRDERAYLEKLKHDIESADIREEINTLYIGGGTPVIFSAGILEEFYKFLKGAFCFAPDAEITSECNPESLTAEKADVMSEFINRVSMGVQSFSKERLISIGRRTHDPASAERAFTTLRGAGFRNIGLDLIFGLPGETLSDWKDDLKKALQLGPTHLSAYSLILEDGTPLTKRLKHLPVTDELSADMWEFTGSFLADNGLPRYEISNYAPWCTECRHNQNVWHGQSYFGFGPSACSFDGTNRFEQASPLDRWLAGEKPVYDRITHDLRFREVFMMGLRTVRGWSKDEIDWTPIMPELHQLEADGLLCITEERVIPTFRGLSVWDDVAETLLG